MIYEHPALQCFFVVHVSPVCVKYRFEMIEHGFDIAATFVGFVDVLSREVRQIGNDCQGAKLGSLFVESFDGETFGQRLDTGEIIGLLFAFKGRVNNKLSISGLAIFRQTTQFLCE
jgi:hypothetical protein